MNNFRTTKIKVDINLVSPNPWNPNKQDDAMFRKQVQSVKELGFLGSILVREWCGMYQILDGEHRWTAAKELEYTEITIESMGEIEDNEAKLLTVLLNNLKGKDDVEKRAKIFQQLEAGQLQLLPFTEEEIVNQKKLIEFDFSQYDKEKQDKKDKKENSYSILLSVSELQFELYQNFKSAILGPKKITETDFFFNAVEEMLQLEGYKKEVFTDEEGNGYKKYILN